MIRNDRDGAFIARAMHGALISQSEEVEITDAQFAIQVDEDRIKGALACAAGTPVTILENHLLDHQFLERNDSEFFTKLMLVRPEAATSTMESYVQQYLKPAAQLTQELLKGDPGTIQITKRRPSSSHFRDIPEEVIDICVQERQKAMRAAGDFLVKNWKKFQEIHQGTNHDGARGYSCYLVSGTPHYVWDASGGAKRMVSKMCYFTGITPKGINRQLEHIEGYLQRMGGTESTPCGNIRDFFSDPDERFLPDDSKPVRGQLCVNLMTLTNKIWQYMKGTEQDKRKAAQSVRERGYLMPTNDADLKVQFEQQINEIFNPYWPISFNRYNGFNHFIRCGVNGLGITDFGDYGCFRHPNPLTFEVYHREATKQDIRKDPIVYRPARIVECNEQTVDSQKVFETLGLLDLWNEWQQKKILTKPYVQSKLRSFLKTAGKIDITCKTWYLRRLYEQHVFDTGEIKLGEWTELKEEFRKAGTFSPSKS